MTKTDIQTVLDALQDALEIADAATRSVNWPEANHAMVILQAALAEPSTHRATGWVAPVDRYAVPVLFNPYTGEPRDVRDVSSDPQGILIVPPGRVEMLAAKPALAEPSEPCGYDETTGLCTKTDCCAALAEPSDPVGKVVSSGPADFPIFQWISADHSLRCKTGDLLYLHPSKSDKDLIQALTERDEYHDMADKLAEGIALHFDGDIGEHSSSNSPWDRALDLLDSAACAETMRLSKPATLPELTNADIIGMAYDCNALPECITDKSLLVFARTILAAAREKAK